MPYERTLPPIVEKFSAEELKRRITEYIEERGGDFTGWYVGVCEDAEDRLFGEPGHGVDKQADFWMYLEALSGRSARSVESYFVGGLGAVGEKGGPPQSAGARCVYAYKMSERTNP